MITVVLVPFTFALLPRQLTLMTATMPHTTRQISTIISRSVMKLRVKYFIYFTVLYDVASI